MARIRRPDFKDPRDSAAYTVSEAARYVKVPAATLRSWVTAGASSSGRASIRSSLIRPPVAEPPALSFWNLIEAHVLRSLRTQHGVSLGSVRKAIHYAEQEFGIERLLLRKELCTKAGKVFLKRYSELIELSASGQIAMGELLNAHLKRVDWDSRNFPVRLHPFLSSVVDAGARPIVIDPTIGFGRPTLEKSGISTAVIADRIDAGESLNDISADYGIPIPDITQALLYERAA